MSDTSSLLNSNKWNIRFLNLAKEIAEWSKDPSTKCGAIIIKNRRILATGYNGFPANFDDEIIANMTREEKLSFTVHAEMNAVINAVNHGISIDGATLFVYGLPICSNCAKHIVSTGIKEVIYFSRSEEAAERWKSETLISEKIFNNAKKELIHLNV